MKRITSVILCICMLCSNGVLNFVANAIDLIPEPEANPKIVITLDGEPINELSIGVYDKKILVANAQNIDVQAYQWQILMDNQKDLWVNIYDKLEASCEISYAVLDGMLNESNCAYVRCKISSSNSYIHYSDPVKIEVVYEKNEAKNEISTFGFRSLALLSESDPDLITITINYLDFRSYNNEDTKKNIFTSYVASIISGSEFKQTVVSPTFLGYAPYYDPEDPESLDSARKQNITTNATQIVFNEGSVTKDITINIYYKPIAVNYAISYYFQNIHDDFYTQDASRYFAGKAETGTIINNDDINLHAGDITGFALMYHIPDAVAADGSTVFECYYDREYFLLHFDNDGGYGVDPIYARYGTPFVVNNPVRYGYVFKGWDELTMDTDSDGIPDTGDGVADTIDTTIQANYDSNGNKLDKYYKALWQAEDTTYTMAYWAYNADGSVYYLHSEQRASAAGATVTGTDDLDTFLNCTKTVHTHTGECGIAAHNHTLECFSNSYLNNPSAQDLDAFRSLPSGIENGYAYFIQTSDSSIWWTRVYINNTWYSIGNANNTSFVADVSQFVDKATSQNYPTYTAYKFEISSPYCPKNCGITAHTHSADCTGYSNYLQFLRAETKEIKGDGSTVVNVYYTHKNYTLRFYYARSSGEGDNIVYEVVGGSTWDFGYPKNTNPKTNIEDALENVKEDAWGEVTEPTIKDTYINQKFTKNGTEYNYFNQGSVTYNKSTSSGTIAYTYYYFEFTAPFGSDITSLWPVDMFNSVTITEPHSSNHGGTSNVLCTHGTQAYFSAWNGEDRVKYTQTNSNPTIKGLYTVLDNNLIFNSAYKDSEVAYTDHNGIQSSLVSYLCFWENGADVGWSIPKLFQYYVYLELLPDELEALGPLNDANLPENIVKKNDRYYKISRVLNVYDNSEVGDQTRASIVGYEYNADLYDDETINDGSDGSMKHYKLHYFYNRLSTTQLLYNNYGEVVTEKSGRVDYAEDISGGYFVPEYPNKLEPNAYVFDGWYTTSECLEGSKFNFENARMPATDLTLYANWIPTKHTVKFFLTLDNMNMYLEDEENNQGLILYSKDNIVHGNVVGSIENPTNTDKGVELVFEGWFYLENGVKKAFHPLNMSIKKDMNFFASWGSKTTQPYMVRYVLKENPDIEVAPRTTGFAFTGSTKTFQAKTGNPFNQLYEQYSDGYFPTVASHSITIQYEEDHANPQNNVYTFFYVKAQNIQYTVNYLDIETGRPVADSKTVTTAASIVTERFVAVADMVPDAFYKRLVIAVEEKDGVIVGSDTNVINFYYTKNVSSAFYAVHFMLQKLGDEHKNGTNYAIDGTGDYEEAGSHIEGIADVGSTVDIPPQDFAGFVCNNRAIQLQGGAQNNVNITDGTFSINITEDGTELYVFYKRASYSYKVNYYLYNSTNSVDGTKYPSINGSSPYGSVIEYTAPVIDGYTCVNVDENAEKEGVQLYLEIKNNTDVNNASINDLIFYYAPKQFTIEYFKVPEAGGTISTTIEVLSGNNNPVGATAAANEYYQIGGWYKDEACTIPVTEEDGTLTRNNDGSITFVPKKESLSETESNRFYAKYNLLVGDLTIIKSGAETADQVFVYTITNNLTGESMNVTIVGNSSVTIKNVFLGEYTIKQDKTWSWRYDDEIKVQSISNVNGTTIQFSGNQTKNQWLNGNSEIVVNK